MRTEEEIHTLITRLSAEYERANAEATVDPIRVTKVSDATYQISVRQTMASLAQLINLLRWVLGEFDIPPSGGE